MRNYLKIKLKILNDSCEYINIFLAKFNFGR